jgi:phage FluMu gp28-like protein
MSPILRHIILKNNTNYEEYHAISKPTTTAFISKKIMETNAEKESVRQASEIIYD